MKHINLFIFIQILLPLSLIIDDNLSAQSFTLYGDKSYGGIKTEANGNIIKIGDFEFIIIGSSVSNVSGDKLVGLCDSNYTNEIDHWLVKSDTAFIITWQSAMGGSLQDRYPYLYHAENSNKLFFTSSSQSDISCNKSENSFGLEDYWIGEVDLFGSIVWERTIGGSFSDENSKITQLGLNELLICGVSTSPVSGLKTIPNFGMSDYWCIKTDSVGTILWDKVYGGTDQERGENESGLDLALFTDGSVAIVGTTFSSSSGNITATSNGSKDILIMKIDTSGNVLWDKLVGGSFLDVSNDACVTPDNGMIICGTTASPQSGDVSEPPKGQSDIWVVKLDSLGNKQWDKRYGGTSVSNGAKIQICPDGGYWVAGNTKSSVAFDVSETGYGNLDYWIIKIDSVGNKLWDKRFGGPGLDWLEDFIILADSSILLFGYADSGTSAVKTDSGKGDTDYWIVHFKYDNSTTGFEDVFPVDTNILLYPNPSSGMITFPSQVLNSEMKVYDLSGRIVYNQDKITNSEVDLSNLQNGYYLFEFIIKGKSFKSKWVKV